MYKQYTHSERNTYSAYYRTNPRFPQFTTGPDCVPGPALLNLVQRGFSPKPIS